MRAEFFRPEEPDRVLGSAAWGGARLSVDSADEEIASAVWRIFRPTAVAVDDPSFRTAGTAGPVVLPPGSLMWFQAAARVRSQTEGIAVRFVPEGRDGVGWDPAGAYRLFSDAIDRNERVGSRGGHQGVGTS